jgi:ribulose-phosphate 3-epimerase
LELIKQIRAAGMKVGVAIKPKTEWQRVTELAPLVDMILVMTVEPGFGGQKFMADMMPKVSALRAAFPNVNIQVDGGVDTTTVHKCAAAGANVIVSGSGVFGAKEGPREAISTMKRVVQQSLEENKKAPAAAGTSTGSVAKSGTADAAPSASSTVV